METFALFTRLIQVKKELFTQNPSIHILAMILHNLGWSIHVVQSPALTIAILQLLVELIPTVQEDSIK